jgi:uncharacterized protein YbaR (Trm112 family)
MAQSMSEEDRVSDELLPLLQCPVGKGPLVQQGRALVCQRCGVSYPVIDGIPALVRERAILPDGVVSFEELVCKEAG